MDKTIEEKYIKAGEIAKKAKDLAKKELKSGISVLEFVEKIESFIKKEAGLAFPVNISINDFSAHCTPDINDTAIFKEGDLVKVDLGVQVDGYIADTAFSIKLGEKNNVLIKAAEDALKEFIDNISPGKTIEEMSKLVEQVVASYGVKTVKNLAGHSLQQYVQHGGLSIPNTYVKNKYQFKEGDVIAMEIFTTNGEGFVVESSPTNIYMFLKQGALRLDESKKILNRIMQEYKTLPFAKRWLKDLATPVKLNMALKEMVERGVLRDYPPLRERSKGLVAQVEETIIIKDKPIITTI
ncbi:MAG: type II methionyl aminopeptidase [Candidatus Aenigmarchaeota archaeon]|nr:type II methionyl aminopeptidase [Candidatus Aenigmarchaeota archaeon]MCX8179412.1 type II methionyl aminopeptidase [Candidatus Aenigmarchaeota archaeon]